MPFPLNLERPKMLYVTTRLVVVDRHLQLQPVAVVHRVFVIVGIQSVSSRGVLHVRSRVCKCEYEKVNLLT